MTAQPVFNSQLSPVKRTLLRLEQLQSKLDAVELAKSEPIAIVGMSCRFPGGADNPEAFWRLLRDGVDAITEVPASRWNIDAYYDPDPEAPGRMYCRYGGFLEGVDLFDPAFFRITPREAASMDPQQRLLLEVTHEALEDAGIPVENLKGSQTGVFVGITTNDYANLQLKNGNAERIDGYFFTGNPLNTAAGRISYTLGSHGPSMALDTACSSSLASVHAACQSLRNQECDLAIAGGVNLILSPDNTIAVCRARALAPDGRCKTFDASADGFVRSEGCGVVILKGLSRAMSDRDRVLAVIRGSAINHDGASSGFTAPNGRAQEAVIRSAVGNLPAHSIDYVEAHGTGTALGDPIEVRALASVLGAGRSAENKLRIGSVKTNIGHAESASGIAGLIKVVLSLQHQWIPAHLHCPNPSPLIPWSDLPVAVCSEGVDWSSNGKARRGGISAFGASGTNVHVVVEEAPVDSAPLSTCTHRFHPLVLSAKSRPALRELAARYQNWLEANPHVDIATICFSAATGRTHFGERLGLRVSSREDAIQRLHDFQAAEPADQAISAPRVAFLCTGLGSQHTGMARYLYEAWPVFREVFDQCRTIADALLEHPLLDVMFSDGECLDQERYSQCALFSFEYALAALFKSFGVSPGAVMGHGVGEYVTACIAGTMSLEDSLRLVTERAQFMQHLPRTNEVQGLIAVGSAEESFIDALLELYGAGLDINWKAFETRALPPVTLPSYPFQRTRIWFQELPKIQESANPAAAEHSSRLVDILEWLRNTISELIQTDISSVNIELPFLEMGADSIVLIEAVRLIERQYGMKLEMRRFFEDLSTIEALAKHIDESLVPEPASAPIAIVTATTSGERRPTMPWGSPVEQRARGLSPVQQNHLENLTTRYTARTRRSKQSVQDSRAVLADSRATVGFRFSTKEMLYPIVGERSAGSQLWDIDGNQYVDFTMGFGVHLFGHAPDFIQDAIRRELNRSLELGARSSLAGEVATRFSRITGHDRVAFSNTGTEAVMAAMRLARAVTGRDKIVMFTHSYHGHADGTLAAANSTGGTEAVAPGVPLGSVENMIVLEYGSEAALEQIRNLAPTLAAVMVEPVQSRNPSLQPVEFLREIRRITKNAGAALIFDEMITGFRVHPAGAQGLFDIRADLATYGKIIGGGMPLGVIAGTKRFMDGIDGGMWSYGDHSFPAADRTAFGGTFCQHPLAMAAALAVLEKIEQEGPALQSRLNERTAELASTLNGLFEELQAPIRVTWFGSMFRFEFSANLDLFFYHLLEKGHYIWEWRTCFLSSAHTEDDLQNFIQAVRETVEELRAGGFIPARPSREASINAELSEAQRQLWLLSQIDKQGSLAYHVNTTIELRGALDVARMRRAIQSLVDRHEALRTTISADGERQVIRTSLQLDIPLIESNVDLWLEQESRQMFDLSAGPLFRAALLRAEQDLHLLALTAHHIICDGSTMRILLEDLAEAYCATPKKPAPLQFREYLKRTKDRSNSDEARLNREYWLKQCAGPFPILNLPADRPSPAIKAFAGHRTSLPVANALAESLRSSARRSGCTIYMELLAGFQVFLHRMTGQDEVITGIPVTGRSIPGGERLAGYCTHLLPLRSRMQDDLTVSAFLAKTRKALLEALDRQDYPFAELVREIGTQRDLKTSPIISAVFNLEPATSLPRIEGLEVKLLKPVVHYSAFDLSINVIDTSRELLIDCDYNTDLFDESTSQRLLRIYQRLLTAIAADPTALVSRLPLLSDSERHQILEQWNDTAATFPVDLAMHELFERQCAQTPDRTAISYSADLGSVQQISYRELNERAENLAAELRAIGVSEDALIGVYARRNLDLIVAIFAILKAGAAYVPMDPAWPQARIKAILDDAAIPVILTHLDVSASLPSTHARVLFLEDERKRPLEPIKSARASADALAYVIYTSGSTGRPKGVAILHRNAVAFLGWVHSYFSDRQLECVLASTSICFDLSIFEIFGPLSWGGSVTLVENILQLENFSCANEITLINTVPSAMVAILKIGSLPESVNTINLAGEPLTRELVRRIHQHAPQAAVYDLYGPSETTTYSTAAGIEFADSDAAPTIGRPISNTKTYILDSNLEPVPIGRIGDLFIGGAGVAAGYLNQPKLTAQRFIPSPYSRGERLYRTGDLARYRPHGNIDFLGRSDNQIKLRGFRIELGEIEAALEAHPLVEAAIAGLRGAETNARIVAWLLSAHPESDLEDSIRNRLRERLPEYMIPSTFVAMKEFPFLPNGKVDRNRLPDPLAETPLAASEDELETQLAAIWQEVLAQPRISTEANLFHIGGNSLSMVQIASRIRRDLGIDLEIRSLFAFPTISSFAKHISGRRPARYVPILALPSQEHYEVSPSQRRFWAQDRLNAARAGGPVPTSFLFEGPLDFKAVQRCFLALVDRHEILRTRFISAAGEPRQKILSAGEAVFDVERIDIRRTEDHASELRSLEIRELLSPMNLEAGPLFRVKLIRLADTRHVCLCTMHHIITDGWSTEVLLDEFARLYAAQIDGMTNRFPELTVQYKDYAAWLNQLLGGREGARMKGYWLTKLAGIRCLDIPGDISCGDAPGQRSKTYHIKLDSRKASALQEMGTRYGATLFMTLLAAIKALLYRKSGEEDITVGSPVAGRVLPELESQVGPYLNVLALRDSVTGADRYEALLGRVHDTAMEAFSNQLYPLARLLDSLEIRRTPGRNPGFDVGFTLQNQRHGTKRSAGPLRITELTSPEIQSVRAEAMTRFWFLADPSEEGLAIGLVYDAALFSENFARGLLEELESIITQVTESPEIRIRDLQLARTAPRQQAAKLAVELGTF